MGWEDLMYMRIYYYCCCFFAVTHSEYLFPSPLGLPQVPIESSLSPPASLAQPKSTGQVPTLDAANREPTKQAASRESEEPRGAGK